MMVDETVVDTNTRETQYRYRSDRNYNDTNHHGYIKHIRGSRPTLALSNLFILILTSQLFTIDPLTDVTASTASSLSPPGPLRISSNTWGELDQLTINITQGQYQPNHIWNDRIQSNLWYITYTKSYAPLLIRYDEWTNTTITLFTGWIDEGGIVAMTQDEVGRLFLVQNRGVISYFEAPYLPTPNTTMITLIDPSEGMMTGMSVVASGGFAWISVTQPPSPPNVTAAVIRFNLTDSTYTTSLGSDVCSLDLETSGSRLSEDWMNSAVLVTCASGIWSIPMMPTNSSSPFLLVPRTKLLVPVDHQRGRDCLFLSFMNNSIPLFSVRGFLAWYNESTYHSLVEFNPKGCTGLHQFVYSRSSDSVWIICISPSGVSPTSNVLSIQASSDGVVGGSQTLIPNVCNPQMGLQDLQIGPSGLYLACDDAVFHLSGGSLTTLISPPTCLSVNDLQTDAETNLLYLVCDQQLLVIDGDIQYPISLVGDCSQFDQIMGLSLGPGGVTYIVGSFSNTIYYEMCVVEPITPESLLISNTANTTSLGQFDNQPYLWVGDGLVLLISIGFIGETPLFLNSTLQWQPFLPKNYCSLAPITLCTMNEFVYIGCGTDEIIALPINNLTSAIPQTIWNLTSLTEADSFQCSQAFTITPSPVTNELWISCLDANHNEAILIINLTDHTSRNLTVLPDENDLANAVVLDPTSPLVFLVGVNLQDDLAMIALQVYDTSTNTLMIEPLSDGLCDSVTAFRLNPISGVSYMSCLNGNVIALSKQFNCQAGYQWQRNQCQPCTVGHSRGLTPGETWATRIPRCQQCSPGSIAMLPGSPACTACPIGRYQDLSLQQQVCLYCQPGTAQNLTGQTSCPPCPAGQFATNVGLTECELCPPGRYSNSNTSAVCQLCDRGSASQVWGLNTTCPLCQPGTEQLQYGGLTCSTCPLGSFAPQGDPCSTCPLHSYQSTIGQPCVPCDGAGQDGLYCEGGLAYVKEGWFAYQTYDENLHQWIYLTTECPDTFCPGSPLQVSNTSSVNGTDASIEYCLYPRLNSPNNLLCAACADDNIVWGQECVECNEANPLALVLIIIFLFILVGFLLRSSTESAGHLNILLFFIQTAALELRARQTTSTTNWIQIFNLGFLSFNTCVGPMSPLQQILLMYLSPFILLVILIFIGCIHRVLQTHRFFPRLIHKFSLNRYIACIMTILLFCYTNVTVSVVQTFNCVEVTPGVTVLWSQPTVDCSSEGYHQLLILTIIWLVVYVLGFPIAIFFFLLRRHLTLTAASSSSAVALNLTNDLAEPLHHSLALVANRKIPTVTPSASSLSHSQSMSERTLILSCTESDLRWGGLFLSFTHTAWYWQSWILVRRFAFALISVLLYQSPNLAFILFTGLNIFCLLIHLATEPFTVTILNRIDTCAYILLITLSLILNGTSSRSSSSSLLLEVILFTLIVLPSFLFLIYTLRYRLRLLHQRRLERKSRTAAIMNDNSQSMKEKSMDDESESEDEKEEFNERSHANEAI